ncbi:secreted protein containing duf1501 : Uncharacterized protein OS=Singulisphaera acidiphila (strain ATCC BAA-1392 / DSM 18658 / VKM B-2454 / MOB10) GN=Sinac_3968 PE=4 SV=1: DUF1501 [Gemmataceae bacterium]|nr:secreted protein containing duf1501 : Uncharacterized protein OS=Singulisphaera acidiphila (strain ATCC BAA-1392 / DSM 18658 / VKM B-2454 / MOB10) GN=Sinac_3968 PE=4 SV=1: DUF1501 [Gemmataceae bacterium]VTU01889.1 secreted protein containing duf1501 : Uncharacterized protein OS=Singulisphaera acidiphila (strain ATCC BAA-1392 / DSM 18658 / VKM B-2454 / MOB10) GN=Sinac_3968 PE=4 SV=1: DUF1501 [Gemmataceae bacterium]
MSEFRVPRSALRTLDRRHFLRAGAVSTAVSMSGWMGELALAAEQAKAKPKRSCILLWMNGGPSTIDLWDLKPGHENGGPFKEISTTAPGLKIGEHLPKIAMHGDRLAVLRGMTTKEGDHARGTYLMRTGQLPGAAGIQYPSIGALVSKELGDPRAELPNFLSIAPQRFFAQEAFGPGFLGPVHAPLIVGENQAFNPNAPGTMVDDALKVADLAKPKAIDGTTASVRLDLLREMQEDFAAGRPGQMARSHAAAYDRAIRLMQSDGARIFDLATEPEKTRDKYGRNLFGQGCLLARRLVEKGVPFVEVSLGNWDTHGQNFDQVKNLCGSLDAAWGALMDDLKDRGLLDTTTIVWMGEFGRTPKINQGNGRDHYPNAWSTVLAGGGIKGGQAVGKTSKDGTTVEERPTTTLDMLATLCMALGIDYEKTNPSNVGRPIRIVDKPCNPVTEVVA